MLINKTGSYKDAINHLVNVFDAPCVGVTMRQHLNSAFWQEQQFNQCKQNLDKSQVIAVYDFAQNYTTMYQDAIKSSEFGKNQITLHPIPAYYWDSAGNLTRETIVIASDDLTHDYLAVST